ncbi:hypothetical protein [Staphylococcus felis]
MNFYGNIPIKKITSSKHQEFINDLIEKNIVNRLSKNLIHF